MNLRSLVSEFLGTAILVAVVIGSGIMATNLSTDVGVQLLINTISTIFALYILIELLAPLGGAHFNPVVSGAALILKKISLQNFIAYIFVQFAGGFVGAVLANLMFGHPAIEQSTRIRSGGALFLSEVVATAGLVFIIFSALALLKNEKIPLLVSLWIGSAYLFTSSTSFANPAVTFARSWSESFAGIALESVPLFIAAQLFGGLLGLWLCLGLFPQLRKVAK